MPDTEPPIPYLLAYAHTLTSRDMDNALRRYDLTVRKFGLLMQLDLEPELTMSELARQLGISRQSLQELVLALERAGYLHRRPGASGRTRKLELTAAAHRLLAGAQDAMRRLESRALAGLDHDEIATLRRLLRRLLAHATDDEAWL